MSDALVGTSAYGQRVDKVIDAVLAGQPLRDAIKEQRLQIRDFQDVLLQDRERARRYSLAQEFRADIMADEIIHIADSDNDPAKARNQITARQWLASKYNKKYGDRVDLNVTQVMDITATLNEARARAVLPVRDRQTIEDAQTIDLPRVVAHKPADNESARRYQLPGEAPDIFT